MGDAIAGRYRLDEPLAEGSMGVVWRATHAELGRSFAIKFLRGPGTPEERCLDRFDREAQLLAAVAHRYVVSVVDKGVTEDGLPFLVMEYLRGESLESRLRREPPLSVRALLRIARRALLGLDAVHGAGIVHRDLKPQNIVLVPEDGDVIPKLVDFGISRVLEETTVPGVRATALTIRGAKVGTPCYMSPEQAAGLDRVDGRSDLYSLGAVLYEAITGTLPFPHENVVELLQAIIRGPAPRLLDERPELGQPLSAVIARAMHNDPTHRYENAREMSEALLKVSRSVPEDALCPVRAGDDDAGSWMSSVDGDAAPATNDAGATVATSAELDVPVSVSFRLQTIGGMVKERRLAIATFVGGLALVSVWGLVRERRVVSAKAAVLPAAMHTEAPTTTAALARPAVPPQPAAAEAVFAVPDAGRHEPRMRTRAVETPTAVPLIFRDPGF